MPSNVKILLVDDNPMVLGLLQQALAVAGGGFDGAATRRTRC